MNTLPDAKACEFADILDEYEAMIVTANLGKRDTMDDIREAMRLAGLKGADLSDEMTRFRDAVKDRRLIRTNPEKAERKERNRDGSVDYLFVLTEKPSRTREGVKLAPENSQVQTPHDADTGEVLDDGADVIGLAEQLHRHAAAGNTDALTVIAAAKYGPDVMRAVAAGILERDEQNATPPDVAEIAPQSPVPCVNRPEGERESAPGTEEACRSGVKAPAADLYDRAVAVVVSSRRGSTSHVQRILAIGYNEAARLMERMEAEGIVSKADHVGGRRCLIEQNAAADIAATKSCGSAEGSIVQTESTLAGTQNAYPAAEAAEQGTTVCAENDSAHRVVSQPVIEPGPQDTKTPSPSVIAVPGKIVEPFYPDPTNKWVRNIGPEPEMPAFLKRATTDQVGRA